MYLIKQGAGIHNYEPEGAAYTYLSRCRSLHGDTKVGIVNRQCLCDLVNELPIGLSIRRELMSTFYPSSADQPAILRLSLDNPAANPRV